MNKSWHISGTDAGGNDEDYAQLHVGDKGKLLVFVIDGRDVDSAISVPDGLSQADFEPSEDAIKVTDMAEFQKLVDEQFLATWGVDTNIQGWFDVGD
jgi:hypothetical protein